MNVDDAESEKAAELVPAVRTNLMVVLVLAILLGVMLAAGGVGSYVYVQKGREFEAKMLLMETSLQEKTQTIEDLQHKAEVLSGQIHLLRDYAIARSTAVPEHKADTKQSDPAVKTAPVVQSKSATLETKPDAKGNVPPGLPNSSKSSNSSNSSSVKETPKEQNCDLIGKSPEEQVETLRRCVALMDSVEPAPRSR